MDALGRKKLAELVPADAPIPAFWLQNIRDARNVRSARSCFIKSMLAPYAECRKAEDH